MCSGARICTELNWFGIRCSGAGLCWTELVQDNVFRSEDLYRIELILDKLLRSGIYAGKNRYRMMCAGARICIELNWSECVQKRGFVLN